MSTNKPYNIYYPNDPKIKGIFYAGYEAQLNVGRGLICKLVNDQMKGKKKDYKILIFGYPGVGKGTYPYALIKLFTEDPYIKKFLRKAQKRKPDLKSKFCLIHVPCLEMANQYREPLLLNDKLKDLENDINTRIPCIVVLDELDAFTPQYAQVSATLQIWTHKFLDKNNRGFIILGIVNYPVHLYAAVRNRFHQLLYFEHPKQEVVVKILDHFGIPYSKDVAVRLCFEHAVICRQLVKAIKEIIESEDGNLDNLRKLKPEEIVNFLSSYMNTRKEDILNYEAENKSYRKNASFGQDIWIKQLDKILSLDCKENH